MKKTINFFLILIIILTTFSCGGFKKVDQRERPTNPEDRRRQELMKEEVQELMIYLTKDVLQILNLVHQILCGEHH